MSAQTITLQVLRTLIPTVLALSLTATALAQSAPEPSAGAPTEAQKSPVSFSGDMTLASRYVFQGLDYSEGRAVLQPNASLTHRGFTANVWGNYQANRGELNEVDLSLKYGRSFGVVSAAAGYLNLQYPNRPDWDPSQELFAEFSVAAPLSPTLNLHYDFDAGKGTYTTLGISQPVGSSITLATNLFYHGRYYEMTGFPAAEFKVSWQHTLGAYTFTPTVSYFATWENHDYRGGTSVPSVWLFGANVAKAF